jgi:hypothetical protein
VANGPEPDLALRMPLEVRIRRKLRVATSVKPATLAIAREDLRAPERGPQNLFELQSLGHPAAVGSGKGQVGWGGADRCLQVGQQLGRDRDIIGMRTSTASGADGDTVISCGVLGAGLEGNGIRSFAGRPVRRRNARDAEEPRSRGAEEGQDDGPRRQPPSREHAPDAGDASERHRVQLRLDVKECGNARRA